MFHVKFPPYIRMSVYEVVESVFENKIIEREKKIKKTIRERKKRKHYAQNYKLKKSKNGWATMGLEPTGRKVCHFRYPALLHTRLFQRYI